MFPAKYVTVDQEEDDEDHGFEIVNMNDVNMPEVQPERQRQPGRRTRNNNTEVRLHANPVVSSSQERALVELMNSCSDVATHEERRCPDEEVLVTCDPSIFRQIPRDTYSTFVVPDESAEVSPTPLSQEFLSQGTVYSLNEDNISLPNLPSSFMEGDMNSDSPAGSQTMSSGSMPLMEMASAEMEIPPIGSIDQVAP